MSSNVGRKLYGRNGMGYFWRIMIEDAKVEAEGWDWAVVRSDSGDAAFEQFIDSETKQRIIDQYAEPAAPLDAEF